MTHCYGYTQIASFGKIICRGGHNATRYLPGSSRAVYLKRITHEFDRDTRLTVNDVVHGFIKKEAWQITATNIFYRVLISP